MKLPISLLLLAALGQAATPQSTTKSPVTKSTLTNSTPAKTLETTTIASNETKRELDEGNYGERTIELLPKYQVTGSPPKIVYERELYETISDQPPDSANQQQIFGVRLPPMTKISDVLTEHGPSFEAAVAKHLYSPISVYKLGGSTSFKGLTPASSQSFLSNLEGSSKEELPNPHNTANQQEGHVPFPIQLDSRLQQENLPQETFQPQQALKKPTASLYPIFDQLGPFRYQGQVVPSQYIHERGVYQFVPIRAGNDYSNQEGNRDNHYPNNASPQLLKEEPKEVPKQQIDIPVPNQGYYAHPNGAISFASYSHKLPLNTQYDTAPQTLSESFHQLQPSNTQYNTAPQIQSESFHQSQQGQQIRSEATQQSKEQKLAPAPAKPMVYRIIQEVENYQQQPQLVRFQQQPQIISFQQQPRTLNALQQQLLFQAPQQLIELQPLPAFKPLPNSLLTPEFSQHQSQLPIPTGQPPRPFSYKEQPIQYPNYRKFVQAQIPHSHTTPAFLQTPQQLIPTSTSKINPESDQLVSSTTIQPNLKDNEEPKEQLVQKETQSRPQPSLLLAPEVIHKSQPTILPLSVQPTTYLPFVNHQPRPIYFQYPTPPPAYQSTIRPQPPPIQTSPRHEVVIQRQELKEYIFGPSPRPRPTTPYHHRQILPDTESFQIQSQDHQQIFEQLLPLQYQQELQDLDSEQYQLDTRQSPFQQHPHPVQHKLNLSQQQQLVLEQTQQQHLVSEQTQQQHQAPQLLQQHHQESDQSQQHQQGSEQSQQNDQGPEQSQQHHQELEQTQQLHHVKSENVNQTSTLKPSKDFEELTEAAEIQQQLETHSQQQSATEKPEEQPNNLSQSSPSEEHADSSGAILSSILSPIQSLQPQIHAQPQQLTAHLESSPLGVPSYTDVQYFGKFAETIFGNRHY